MDDDRFRAPGAAGTAPSLAPSTPPGAASPDAPVPPPGPWPTGAAAPASDRWRRGRRVLAGGGILLAVLLVFSLGVSVGRMGDILGATPTPSYAPGAGQPSWSLLDQAWQLLEQHYVDPAALVPLTLERGAVSGMANALDDRGHTGYLTPDEVKARDEELSGTFVGVGAVLDQSSGTTVIVRVIPGSPAERAGVRAGDEIVAVDGTSVAGLTVDEIVAKVRGPEGTKVTLELKSTDGTTRSLTITRARIDIPIVSWAFAPGTKDAVIRIESFSTGAAKGVADALRQAMAQGATGVVLDLRGNPGGYVNEPVDTASLFMASGDVYLSVDRSGTQTPHAVSGHPIAPDIPLVVLVDGQTASSAEILTGALQDSGRAWVVGETTYGTGTVVNTYPLADGGALTIGTERWLTPKGRAIWREGLVPNEVVALPTGATLLVPDAFATLGAGGIGASDDAQLKAALAALEKREGTVAGPLRRAA